MDTKALLKIYQKADPESRREWRRRWEYTENPPVDLSAALGALSKSYRYATVSKVIASTGCCIALLWFVATMPLQHVGSVPSAIPLAALGVLVTTLLLVGVCEWRATAESKKAVSYASRFLEHLSRFASFLTADFGEEHVRLRWMLDMHPSDLSDRFEERLRVYAGHKIADEASRRNQSCSVLSSAKLLHIYGESFGFRYDLSAAFDAAHERLRQKVCRDHGATGGGQGDFDPENAEAPELQ